LSLAPGSTLGPYEVLGSLPGYNGSLAVSPDEQTILCQRFKGQTADLMLIENFR
jgi:hypothetical protein